MPGGVPVTPNEGSVLDYQSAYGAYLPSGRLSLSGVTGGLLTIAGTFTAPRTWTLQNRSDTFAGLATNTYTAQQLSGTDSAAAPGWSWAASTNTGWWLSGGANPTLSCGGIDRVLVSSGGSVVISRNSVGMGITSLVTGLDCHASDGSSFSIGLSSYGTISNFTARNAGAGSTVALPLAMTAGQVAAIFGARAYFGTFGVDGAYSSSELARMRVMSAESGALTATAQGFKLNFQATTAGTTTLNSVMDVLGDRVSVLQTLEASAVTAASLITAGGLGVAKRSFLGTIGTTFSGNVVAGVQDATAAVAGQVGEVLSSTVAGVAVAATGTVGNITSITLTRGDWDISASVVIAGGATGLTSGSTAQASIVTTTATNGTAGSTMTQQTVYALVANGLQALTPPTLRVNISASTTYYLTEQVSYTAGSPTASATLTARRIR